jgi:hypothetical protein
MRTNTSTHSIEMNLKREASLELQLKRTIKDYVKIKEGKNFKNEECFDLNYIEASEFISKYRKKNLEKLDSIFEYYSNNENNLANEVKNYLKEIKIKPALFCLEQKPSLLKKMLSAVLLKHNHNRSQFLGHLPPAEASNSADLEKTLKAVMDQNKIFQEEIKQMRAQITLLQQQLKIKDSTLARITRKPAGSDSNAPSCMPCAFGKKSP